MMWIVDSLLSLFCLLSLVALTRPSPLPLLGFGDSSRCSATFATLVLPYLQLPPAWGSNYYFGGSDGSDREVRQIGHERIDSQVAPTKDPLSVGCDLFNLLQAYLRYAL